MKTIKNFLAMVLLPLLFNCSGPAMASQNAVVLPTVSPYPGLTMLNNINSAFNTFQTNFSGGSAPGSPVKGQLWTDTTNNLLKFYDGSNWDIIGSFSSGWTVTSNGFKQVAVTSTGSSNAYVVTYAPAPTAYVTGQKYSFITNFSNSGSATVNFGPGALSLRKLGGTTLAAGDLGSGAVVECIYDGTNCQITSDLSQAASGTITSISTNNGIAGGPITSSGTISLAAIAADTILMNNTTGSAVPVGSSALPPGTTAVTQSVGDNSTKVATTAYVDRGGNGVATGWAMFDAVGSSGTITPTNNFNIGSISKNSTGNYIVNFNTAMADTNYVVLCSAGNASTGNPAIAYLCALGQKSTTGFYLYTSTPNSNLTVWAPNDLQDVDLVVFGN